MTPGLAYHRKKLARQMRAAWWRPEHFRGTEYAWLRSLDRSPRRPLAKLIEAERAIRA